MSVAFAFAPASAPAVAAPLISAAAAVAPAARASAGQDASSRVAQTVACAAGVALAAAGRQRRRAQKGAGRKATVAMKAAEVLEESPPPAMEIDADDPSAFTLGIVGDLHLDPRDMEDSYLGREHFKKILKDSPRPFVVSLGDLGESKDCTDIKQLFSGTTPCFKLAREFLDGFETPFDVVGGNHDLEGIDEFNTDEDNLEAYLRELGKETPQFFKVVADKVAVVGLGSTAFRTATYTSHEVSIDKAQIAWFEKIVAEHPSSEGWQLFVFSHAPIIGSALRVLQENHVVNGCCWLNHTDAVDSKRFIECCRKNSSIKAWFSGHFHLSHDYQDSITFPGGNNRGSCVFAQTGCMTTRSTRDGRRQSRLVRGNATGFEVCTVDHSKGGTVRLDATITYSDQCEVDPNMSMDDMDGEQECSTVVFAHKSVDYDHDKWFSAYVPTKNDGNQLLNPDGTLNDSPTDFCPGEQKTVAWWHMKCGAVLGVHNGMIIEYDAGTLAPLGMVVSRDELLNRRVAVIDDEWGGSALVLYNDTTNEVTVVQPNEDGSYWRKVVRNKMHRMKEMRRVSAAKKWMKDLKKVEDVDVLSSYGPYKTTAGNVMGLTTKAINPKAAA